MIYKRFTWFAVLTAFCFIISLLINGCKDNVYGQNIKLKRYYKLNVEGHDYICIRTTSTSYSQIFGSIVHNPDCKLCRNRKGD